MKIAIAAATLLIIGCASQSADESEASKYDGQIITSAELPPADAPGSGAEILLRFSNYTDFDVRAMSCDVPEFGKIYPFFGDEPPLATGQTRKHAVPIFPPMESISWECKFYSTDLEGESVEITNTGTFNFSG